MSNEYLKIRRLLRASDKGCTRCFKPRRVLYYIVGYPEVKPQCYYCATKTARALMRLENEENSPALQPRDL